MPRRAANNSRAFAFAAAVAAALAAAPAMAQPVPNGKPTPVRDELAPEPRRAWDAALELYDAQDFEGARIEFWRTYQLSKNARVLFNVGVCDKNLRRYARAAATWRQELAEAGSALSADDRRKVESAIASVQEFVSSVRVEANEPGAVLRVDGEEVGTTPFAEPLALDVGRHTLLLRKEGFADASLDVTVSRGPMEPVRLELKGLRSQVSVAVRGPADATVFVDGTDMGAAPFRGQVMVGRRTFEARAQGFVTTRQTSDLVASEPLELVLVLPPERREGKLRIAGSEGDAEIEIDGDIVGNGAWEGLLPVGGHQVAIRKDGFAPYLGDVSLAEGQIRDLEVPLERDIDGPTWAVWVAGALGVATGAAVASYFAFRPAAGAPVSGSLTPGLVETSVGAPGRSWSISLGGSFE